jgi:hypothetical protein
MMRWSIAFLLLFAAPAAGQQIVFAGGHWASIDRGATCEAGSRALRIAAKGKIQARAGFAFDSDGPRRGQFFALLSRVPRPGSTVVLTVGNQPFLLVSNGLWAWSSGAEQEQAIIAAARDAGGMTVRSRDRGGGRFTDRYMLDGAATAIDAAAARCAGKMQPR